MDAMLTVYGSSGNHIYNISTTHFPNIRDAWNAFHAYVPAIQQAGWRMTSSFDDSKTYTFNFVNDRMGKMLEVTVVDLIDRQRYVRPMIENVYGVETWERVKSLMEDVGEPTDAELDAIEAEDFASRPLDETTSRWLDRRYKRNIRLMNRKEDKDCMPKTSVHANFLHGRQSKRQTRLDAYNRMFRY